MYASPWRFKTLKGPMNRCCNFVDCVFESAFVGRFAVDSNTRSSTLNTSLCFLPFLSACSFCLSTASATASRTKRKIICLCRTNSSIACFSRCDIFSMSLSSSKFASIAVAFATVSSGEEGDFGVDERQASGVSPTLKEDSVSMRREGTRGWRA